MPLIHDSEMEDFKAAIINAGFKVDDFTVVPLEDKPPKILHVVTGTVTVNRILTDQSITYRAGHLSAWSAEFEDDLQAGKFGPP